MARSSGNKLWNVAPPGMSDPQIVLLSPGVFNSAYFEHVFLAREIGIPLVEGRDLFVDDDKVFMKTVSGPRRVHVIYRPLNDDLLDPEVFKPDSVLGVKGLMRAARKGNLYARQCRWHRRCDDKAVYAYVPRMIKYYLDEEPILPNVQTHICREPDALAYTLEPYRRARGEARGRVRAAMASASGRRRQRPKSMSAANN